jgi:hypothetical protein
VAVTFDTRATAASASWALISDAITTGLSNRPPKLTVTA